MSILSLSIFFAGTLSFLYFFWRRLKEDYTSLQIFSVGFYSLIALVAFFFLFKFLFTQVLTSLPLMQFTSGVLFWISLSGSFLAFIFGIYRYKIRFFESFEAWGVGSLFLLMAVFIADTFESLSVISLVAATVTALLITVFYFLETKYRDFGWYKSGKVGFSGLTTLAIFFLMRSLVAIAFPFVLSFLGKWETVLSGIASFLLFFAVYNLSQQK